MFKKALNFAVCAAAVVSGSAFAQSPAQVAALQETKAGKTFLENTLKISPAAKPEAILNAIKSLPAAQSAAVAGAITAFAKQQAPAGSTLLEKANAKKANEAVAASIFTANNKAVELAALTSNYSAKSDVQAVSTAKSSDNVCSSVLDAGKMEKGTKISFATWSKMIDEKYIGRGKCNENPEEMENLVSKNNLGEIGACAMAAGSKSVETYAGCASNVLKVDFAKAKETVLSIDAKCGWFGAKVAANAK